eukprot:TRINITY_DN9144_c0_g1_i1.p1 TRINITY_DN9144_c0_g1~~TRINITY_DN9144_c0_g1_i1.p1  ORF type:complete len:605 (+),score=218.13 TRINITY_DN9144_c0_g1_i1:55-1869(+)
MPTIGLNKKTLYEKLELDLESYSTEEFENLCFEFGVELDAIETTEEELKLEDATAEQTIFKIDIPANRYDLLCMEGFVTAVRVFLEKDQAPVYKTIKPDEPIKMYIEDNVDQIRPIGVAAILRNINFDEKSYQSFIDLQDKLHQNICRDRRLVSIGTHDLDTIEPPFTYKAIAPKEINFVPLKMEKEVNGADFCKEVRENAKHVEKYLALIEDSPVYPVIYDSNNVVLSLPPILNGEHSKIQLSTKNIFIEITALDHTKANVVLNTICAAFSLYTQDKFTCEIVEVVKGGESKFYPNMSNRTQKAEVSYINKMLGLNLSKEEIVNYLKKMLIIEDENNNNNNNEDNDILCLSVPPTRSDILHQCDIAEDVGISFGYDNILAMCKPPPTNTVGGYFPLNAFCDLVRTEIANAGYVEVINFVLCSKADCYSNLRREEDGNAVVLANSVEKKKFQIGRVTLLAGLLKTLSSNRIALPIKIFECSDIMVNLKGKKSKNLEIGTEVGSMNRRYFAAVYQASSAGNEHIHGLLDFVMEVLGVERKRYSFDSQNCNDDAFFPLQRAHILLDNVKIGTFGVIHPAVLQNFNLNSPCSALEFDIQTVYEILNE